MRSLSILIFVLTGCGGSSDAPIDAPAPDSSDPCATCTANQLCVQRYDGTCGMAIECVTPTLSCPNNACSVDCQTAYCPMPYQCMTRSPCGGESPTAFRCYGP